MEKRSEEQCTEMGSRWKTNFVRCRSICCDSTNLAQIVKIILAASNFICLVFGLVIVSVSVLLLYDNRQVSSLYQEFMLRVSHLGPLIAHKELPFILFGVGSAVAIYSFLGCWGACAESACCLFLHLLLAFSLLTSEVIAGLCVTVIQEKAIVRLQSVMQKQLHNDYNDDYSFVHNDSRAIDAYAYHVTVTWDIMQRKLKCCGVVGPEDYQRSAWMNRSSPLQDRSLVVPVSCCTRTHRIESMARDIDGPTKEQLDRFLCQADAKRYIATRRRLAAQSVNTQGCQYSLLVWFRSHIPRFATLVSFVVSAQMLDFVLSCLLMRWKKEIDSTF